MDDRSDFQRRLGVGERQRLYGRHVGTTRDRPVIADDGPSRGRSTGFHTDHWDGRVDATVRPETVRVSMRKPKEQQ